MADNDDNIPGSENSHDNNKSDSEESLKSKQSADADRGSNSDNPLDEDVPGWNKTIDEKHTFKPEFKDTTSPGKLKTSGLPIPEALINRELGSGKIVGYIGSGGMGDVYKIWNESINRHHAVKLLRHGSTLQQEKRFEREIKITASFDHPNIVHIYGAGKWKGYLFLEMEFVEGKALDTLLQDRKKIDPATAVAIGMLVARALHYAHNHTYKLEGAACTGAIHRDLKPSNIMLAEAGKLKLMDFGIARPVSEDCTTLTMGGIVGSWAYLPPEQLDGSPVTFRADIYALGEVLYEMLTGKPAFTCENQRDFIRLKVKGKYRSLQSDDGAICTELIQVIDKCMKVNPDSRFQSATDLEKELGRCLRKITPLSPEEVLVNFTHDKPNPKPVIPKVKKLPDSTKQVPVLYSIIAVLIGVIVITFYTGVKTEHGPESPVDNISAPQTLAPSDNDTLKNDTVLFIWNSSAYATRYSLFISSDSTFTDRLIRRDSIVDTTYTLTGFKDGGPVFWKIGVYGNSTPVWSAVKTFFPPAITIGVPVLAEPLDNKKDCDSTVTFSWNSPPNTDAYQLSIASDEAFEKTVFDTSGLSDTAMNITLSPASSFHWRVRGCNGTEKGEWSGVFTFSTRELPKDDGEYYKTAAGEIRSGNPDKALEAINHVRGSSIRKDTIRIRIAELYVGRKNYKKARSILKTVTVKDLHADVLRSRVLISRKKYRDALALLNKVSNYRTFFDSKEIRGDHCYYRAKAAQYLYQTEKTTENLMNALSCWRAVYDYYRKTPDHPRFIEAKNVRKTLK